MMECFKQNKSNKSNKSNKPKYIIMLYSKKLKYKRKAKFQMTNFMFILKPVK